MTTARSSASAVYRRIDMSHGLMQSIVRNQIDRDEYHKIMTEKTDRVKREVESVNQRRTPPRTNLYVPPHLRRAKSNEASTSKQEHLNQSATTSSQSSSESSPDRLHMRRRIRERLEKQLNKNVDDIVPSLSNLSLSDGSTSSPTKTALFNLSLKTEDGVLEDFIIYNTDNPARTSKSIGRKCGLSEEECRRLRLKIEEEQKNRMKG